MPQPSEQTLERRLRRTAARYGYVLRKNRSRTPSLDYGKWYVVDADRNFLVRECGDLDQVAAFLED
jgi:hypothetical protein